MIDNPRLALLLVSAVLVGTPAASACEGVRLYTDVEFRGGNMPLVESVPNLHHWAMGDESESLLVPGGCRVVFFEERDFAGRSFEVLGPAYSKDLAAGAWANAISSVRVSSVPGAPVAAFRGNEIVWSEPDSISSVVSDAAEPDDAPGTATSSIEISESVGPVGTSR